MGHYIFPESGGGRWKHDAELGIAAGGTISLTTDGLQHWEVGAATPISLSITPFGVSGPPDGTVIRLQGTDDTNTVTLPHNDAPFGCKLFGSSVLKDDYIIELVWREVEQRYIEFGRNN